MSYKEINRPTTESKQAEQLLSDIAVMQRIIKSQKITTVEQLRFLVCSELHCDVARVTRAKAALMTSGELIKAKYYELRTKSSSSEISTDDLLK